MKRWSLYACMFICLSYMFVSVIYKFLCDCLNMQHFFFLNSSICAARGVFHAASALGSAMAKQKQDQNGQKCKGTVSKGKAQMAKGEKKTSKGKGAMIISPGKKTKGNAKMVHRSEVPRVTRSKVHRVPRSKVPRVPRSKVKVPKTKVPKKTMNGRASNDKAKDIIYARVSSSKQADKAGFKRQQEKCQVKAGKTKTVREVVSGSLPAADRTQLVDILTKNNGKKVFIENPRTLARSTVAGEQLYELSKKNNVQIVAVDMPELFQHEPTAGIAFLRRVMLATQEFERDIIVERLQHGLARAKAKSQARTQNGAIKVQGSKTTLEQMKPSKDIIKEIRSIANKDWSQRTIRDYLRELLDRPSLGTSTAMRMMSEVQNMA